MAQQGGGQKRRIALAAIREDGENRVLRGISHLTTLGSAKLQSAPGADSPCSATESENKIVRNSYVVCRKYRERLRPIYVNWDLNTYSYIGLYHYMLTSRSGHGTQRPSQWSASQSPRVWKKVMQRQHSVFEEQRANCYMSDSEQCCTMTSKIPVGLLCYRVNKHPSDTFNTLYELYAWSHFCGSTLTRVKSTTLTNEKFVHWLKLN